ncbi:MAG TPA: hypothetical protein VMG37_04015 [Solirubrobacteraceae bacterium]|nr:hypothetical protein [Solirubrobacteraceae bacterium]
MTDLLSERCGDLLTGSYDCVDRIVLNAYFSLGHSPGGFRTWWRRWHTDGDERLDNAHLKQLAGRFARRVRASAQAHGIAVIDCNAGERKHQIAEDYLAKHPPSRTGVFLILVSRSPATVWKVDRSAAGVICNLQKTRQFVNHYSFHIIDPTWGHVTIKISGHPPFGAQVILNGHEYVACAARSAGIGFRKEGNCFTQAGDPERLAQIADTFSQPGGIGRLSQVIDRWIYTASLCYGLSRDEQQQSGFVYDYSIYQVEYSRNLVFASGAVMDRLFNTMVDRTRSRLDLPTVRTLFGSKGRPHRPGNELSPRQAVVIEKPLWNLTIFKVHFGLLTLKAYTKGERVLRFEAIAHHTKQLRCGRTLDKFPQITSRLTAMVDRFTSMLDCVEVGFLPDGILDQLPAPSQIAATRVGGIDLNRPRVRGALAATLALAVSPAGFSVAEFAAKVRAMTGQTPEDYSVRQGAYDLRKLRGKQLLIKPRRTRRYHVPETAARTITALLTLRDKVIAPLIAGFRTPRHGRPPKNWTTIDRDYETLRRNMQTLLNDLGISTKAATA